jgi:hypothetical protein
VEQDIPSDLYEELLGSLPSSDGVKRKLWAERIVYESIDLKLLYGLLREDKKVATRFLWLLSDIGLLAPGYLLLQLPDLFAYCQHNHKDYLSSFASYWLYVGVPEQQEAQAIDVLFQCLYSGQSNTTLKSRSMWVLAKLSQKHPELKNELRFCLEDQKDKYTADFAKRVDKILLQIH